MNATSATAIAENVLIEAPREPLADSSASPDWVIDDGLGDRRRAAVPDPCQRRLLAPALRRPLGGEGARRRR